MTPNGVLLFRWSDLLRSSLARNRLPVIAEGHAASMLTYIQVYETSTNLRLISSHIIFTLPPLVVLYILYRPLVTKLDTVNCIFHTSIAFFYTTPWDSFIIRRGIWTYDSNAVIGTIFSVPIEEYCFFIIQTVTTLLFYYLVSRVSRLPIYDLAPMNGRARRLCQFPVIVFLMAALSGIVLASRDTTFYIGSILVWACPVLAGLWMVGGAYIVRRWRCTLPSILVPTFYYCFVDTFAIGHDCWHITASTSLGRVVWSNLPVEEALFFLVTNCLLVFGTASFEKASIILHTLSSYSGQKAPQPSTSAAYFRKLVLALLNEQTLTSTAIFDITACVETLKNASSSFYGASFVFPHGVRQDLCALYAFCRMSDDVVDNQKASIDGKRKALAELRSFINTHFLPKVILHSPNVPVMDTRNLVGLDPRLRAVAQTLARKIPAEPFLELFEGYEQDIESPIHSPKAEIKNEHDLRRYCACVASSVAEMCLYVMTPLAADSQISIYEDTSPNIITMRAREMGMVLQLVNIARDIITDAQNRRVYVPTEYFTSPKERTELLKLGERSSISEALAQSELPIGQYALRILDLATVMYQPALEAIEHLPVECRPGVRSATAAYWQIGISLRERLDQPCANYPLRERLSTAQRLCVVIASIYNADTRIVAIMLVAVTLRVVLLLYGVYQDSHSALKYTDVDYKVFTDAAKSVWMHQSAFERATYRYTPLLAWILLPSVWKKSLFSFGKIIFAAGDLVAGYLLIQILCSKGFSVKRACRYSAIWLLNPMVAVISTRGSSEGLLGAMVVTILWAIYRQNVALAGCFTGLAVHFKIYPIIYVPTIFWAMQTDDGRSRSVDDFQDLGLKQRVLNFLNPRRRLFCITCGGSFAILTVIMFLAEGFPYLHHAYFHHLTRSDHRHNFSPYNTLLYLTSSPAQDLLVDFSKLAFLPQILIAGILLPVYAKMDLCSTMFAQTFAFVAFNKVCTSQYFMWYMVLLPLYLPYSTFLRKPKIGILVGILWVLAQALWLHQAYLLEFWGQNTFYPELFAASIAFFAVNIWILVIIIQDLSRTNTVDDHSKTD